MFNGYFKNHETSHLIYLSIIKHLYKSETKMYKVKLIVVPGLNTR